MTRVAAFLLLAVGACDPVVDACRQQCDKRAACGQRVDVDQCHEACADAALPDDECSDAQLALQRCQVTLACETYLADEGCDAERATLNDVCL